MIPLGVDDEDRKMDGVAGNEAMTTFCEVKTSGLDQINGGREGRWSARFLDRLRPLASVLRATAGHSSCHTRLTLSGIELRVLRDLPT